MDLCEFEGSLVYIVPVHPRLHSKTLSQEQEQKCFTCTIGLGRINIMEKLKDWFVALSSLRKSCIQDLVTEWDNLKLFSMYKGYSLIHAYSYSFIFIHSLTHSITLSVCLSIPRLLFFFILFNFLPSSLPKYCFSIWLWLSWNILCKQGWYQTLKRDAYFSPSEFWD